jgi:hypothetical protein
MGLYNQGWCYKSWGTPLPVLMVSRRQPARRSVDIVCLALLLLVSLVAWIPRLRAPLDLR